MPDIYIKFQKVKQLSLQISDIAYYASTPSDNTDTMATSGGFTTASQNDLIVIGPVTNIDQSSLTTTIITCDIDADTPPPTTKNFILFAKDNIVNTTSLLGYYGSVKFKNSSREKAELFSVGCEINESSK